jgi:predicted ATPase/DNA-binding SARP family transcriptional activator
MVLRHFQCVTLQRVTFNEEGLSRGRVHRVMWTIQLLGGLSAHSPQRQLTRFRTQKAASLLAFLAFHHASQPRELLLDLLWPDAEPEVGRHNLSNALSFLRHLLEPPGVPPGTVILADRASVRLNPAAVTVDAREFESQLNQARTPALTEEQRLALLLEALERYTGPLLPGYYEKWVAPEALRLEGLFVQGALLAAPLLLGAGRAESALTYVQRAVSADPLSEEATSWLMQAYVACGQAGQAQRAYRQLEARLQEELGGASPSLTLQRLAEQAGYSGSSPLVSAVSDRALSIDRAAVSSSVSRDRVEQTATIAAGSASMRRLVGGEFLLRMTTRFFGREEEVDRLGKILSTPRTRLVTLTGPGGSGKTRLALETAAQLIESTVETLPVDVPTSVIFIPLAAVTTVERLYDVMLRSLSIVPTGDRDLLDQLVSALEAHPNTLLVMDNFEQLANEGAACIHALLVRTDGVKLLVTSRQPLHIEGEREFRLASLPLSAGAQTAEELLTIPSIALFVDRAQTGLSDFQLTERNAVAVAQLCDYLEGLPLAIELAAARVALLSPAHILDQVHANRLDFLATRRRDADSRQKTLRATLDWSYRLLPEAGQRFLASLSVFQGGWTLAAAQAVCGLSEAETWRLLNLLRDSSLIGVIDIPGEVRFSLLETIREYASERLDLMGEREALSERHLDYFLALAQSAEGELTGSNQGVWLDRLNREHDNLRSALAWSAMRASSAEAGLRLSGALYRFWYVRGYWSEGRQRLKRALEHEGAQEATVLRARALDGAGALAYSQGDYVTARALHEESLSLRRELGDRQGVAWSLNSLGNIVHPQGDYALARDLYQESQGLFRELGDRQGVARSLSCLGYVALDQGDCTMARASFEEGLSLFKELGDRGGIAWSLCCLGYVAYQEGGYATAHTLLEEGLSLFQALEDGRGIAWSLNSLGNVAHAQGDCAAARALHEQSLNLRKGLGDRQGMAWSLICLGDVTRALGDPAAARTLLNEGMSLFHELGDRKGVAESLGRLAAVSLAQAEMASAVRLWGVAHMLRETIGSPLTFGERESFERQSAEARTALGEGAYAVAWNEGGSMTWEQTIACVQERTGVSPRREPPETDARLQAASRTSAGQSNES